MTSHALCRAETLLEQAGAIRAVIGLDTGASPASLAIVLNGRIAAEISRPAPSHGAALAGAVDDLLATAGITIRELGAIAVGIGPGSFTGLRIGVSYAKGIAFGAGCAIAGVPSLDAIALGALDAPGARPGLTVRPILDARKGEVYTALYRIVANGLEKLSQDLVMPLARLISELDHGAIVVGDTKANDAAALAHRKGIEVTVSGSRTMETRGRYVAALGAARIARGESDSAGAFEPLYVRPPQAEAARAARASEATTEGVWSTERKNSFGSI
ncbi:MAG TPA: tRNA (adenosine(37)-N6)-threonylcarbamoyltransferase complex dimerization subunit type 1 TsaB [Candidatus Binataceae bacterium]|nr:tRNA (adenosine(37)-N6)-threonylcarbamoyltransferase complex dimerization subunit type 1 TsaB [Candidatus Binataceae bacterium]